MISWNPIESHLGAKIQGMSCQQALSIDSKHWQDLLYKVNVIVIDHIDLTRESFYQLSLKFGIPWSKELHHLHGETIEEDMVVNWSDKSGLKKVCIPWHTDNSWHPTWRNPIRMLYGVAIPDPNSGCLNYLNLSYAYEHVLDDLEKEEIKNWQVLVQDYKNKNIQYWYPLIQKNPVSGKKSIFITAMDINSPEFGFTKAPGYQKGNTFLLKIKDQHGNERPLSFLVEYAKKCMKIKGCFFEQKWKPKMLQIISNLDMVHCRTTLSDIEDERMIWRKTIAHYFQGADA